MSRKLLVMDRVSLSLWSSGKPFVHLLLSWSGVPGVLSTRTIENEKIVADRNAYYYDSLSAKQPNHCSGYGCSYWWYQSLRLPLLSHFLMLQ